MVQKVVVSWECDLPGRHDGEIATVDFGLDRKDYALDLCVAHRLKFTGGMVRYREAARRVTSAGRPMTRVHVGPDPVAVRRWAESAGLEVSARGRIPQKVMADFERFAHNGSPQAALAARRSLGRSKADAVLVQQVPDDMRPLTRNQREALTHIASHGTKPSGRGMPLIVRSLQGKGLVDAMMRATDLGHSVLLSQEPAEAMA